MCLFWGVVQTRPGHLEGKACALFLLAPVGPSKGRATTLSGPESSHSPPLVSLLRLSPQICLLHLAPRATYQVGKSIPYSPAQYPSMAPSGLTMKSMLPSTADKSHRSGLTSSSRPTLHLLSLSKLPHTGLLPAPHSYSVLCPRRAMAPSLSSPFLLSRSQLNRLLGRA